VGVMRCEQQGMASDLDTMPCSPIDAGSPLAAMLRPSLAFCVPTSLKLLLAYSGGVAHWAGVHVPEPIEMRNRFLFVLQVA
jgi:hypothetical protein